MFPQQLKIQNFTFTCLSVSFSGVSTSPAAFTTVTKIPHKFTYKKIRIVLQKAHETESEILFADSICV